MANDKKVNEALEWYDKNKLLYERCAKTKTELIGKILQNEKISYHSITYRVKDRESYCHKCKNDKYMEPIDEVMDLSGIRIIAYTNQDVKNICDVISREFEIDKINSMDKYSNMNDNQVGYLSVHFIIMLKENRTNLAEYKEYVGIRSEIQVRTLLQHAWAEIEHDRNYKFSGVLPKNIRRKFYLLAGVLELVDKEFDSLSEEIDTYVKETKQKVGRGDYEIPITSKALEQYFLERFDDNSNIKSCSDGQIVTDEIVEELTGFGFETIKDVDENITQEFLKSDNTYIGLLRDVMICKDIQKYFGKVYNNHWGGTSAESIEFWKSQGVKDVEKYINEYEIGVVSEDEEMYEVI